MVKLGIKACAITHNECLKDKKQVDDVAQDIYQMILVALEWCQKNNMGFQMMLKPSSEFMRRIKGIVMEEDYLC